MEQFDPIPVLNFIWMYHSLNSYFCPAHVMYFMTRQRVVSINQAGSFPCISCASWQLQRTLSFLHCKEELKMGMVQSYQRLPKVDFKQICWSVPNLVPDGLSHVFCHGLQEFKADKELEGSLVERFVGRWCEIVLLSQKPTFGGGVFYFCSKTKWKR